MKTLLTPIRRLLRTPVFSLTAVLTLGVGLAALLATFVLIQSVVLRPLPYEQPDSLVRLLAFDPEESQAEWLTWAEVQALYEEGGTLEEVAASTVFPGSVRIDDRNHRVQRAYVSDNYFRMLGVEPLQGRLFQQEAEGLISHRLWQQRFGERADVVGSTFEIDGGVFTVAGVLPQTVYTHDHGGAPPISGSPSFSIVRSTIPTFASTPPSGAFAPIPPQPP